ncbi:MAG: ABC transporter permease [Oscillospiraceae bacterium]
MLIFENISLAISGLWSNKMRALLTMLGIIIGIGSVISIVTVGNSLTNGISEELQSFGANNLTVQVQQKPQEQDENAQQGGGDVVMMGGMGYSSTTVWYSPEEKDLISYDMIADYKAAFPDTIQYVNLQEYMNAPQAKAGPKTSNIQTMGVNEDFLLSSRLKMLTGRLLNENDVEERRKVAVVSNMLCTELFGSEDPIGKMVDIKIDNDFVSFYIVGVYEQPVTKGLFAMNGGSTTSLYIPLSVARDMNNTREGFNDITVVTAPGVDANVFANQTNDYFAKVYAKNKNFYAQGYSMKDMVDSMQGMYKTMSLAISAIAAISLLVGGIGVMNIMLVSITERTREIGTRKALGATNGSIRIQFIVESIIICLIGGIIGIALGLALGSFGSKLIGYAAKPSAEIILIAVSFSMAIGVFFGYYPANKAAKLDPIEALRYE